MSAVFAVSMFYAVKYALYIILYKNPRLDHVKTAIFYAGFCTMYSKDEIYLFTYRKLKSWLSRELTAKYIQINMKCILYIVHCVHNYILLRQK